MVNNCPIFFSYHSSCRKDQSTSAQKRECSEILSDTFQPQHAVQQEASGITTQNVADPLAGPRSKLHPVSFPKPIYFPGKVPH